MLPNLFGDHDAAMLASGAAEGDGQIAFALVDVMRKQVNEQIRNSGDKFLRLRERTNVFRNTRMTSRKRTKFRDKMRVGQKANVEDKIRILRDALTKSETNAGNQNALLRRLLLEALVDMRAQLVHVELRGIDDEIGEPADRTQMPTFLLER